METPDYDSEELPHHISSFLRTQARERADAILEKAQMDLEFDKPTEDDNTPCNTFR